MSATATFSLKNVASAPYAIAAGAGTSQSTELGTDFAVPLAVTVTDNDGNAISGATGHLRCPGQRGQRGVSPARGPRLW